MKRTELEELIRETIFEILDEGAATQAAQAAGVSNPAAAAKTAKETAQKDPTGTATIVGPKGSKVIDKSTPLEEKKDDDEEVEDTYGKEDEDDKKDAKIANAEPSKAELKKLDKEFGSSKFAKKLSPADKERLDKLEAGIKKKLANPTKDNIEIVRQLIKKPEIKKLFKDGGKDLKALISDIIR